jgi:hypothetical protein
MSRSDKLTISTIQILIDQLSYEDNRKLRENIAKEEINNCLYHINFTGHHFIYAESKDKAIEKFIESEEYFNSCRIGDKCSLCKTPVTRDTYKDHVATHSREELIEHYSKGELKNNCKRIKLSEIKFRSVFDLPN